MSVRPFLALVLVLSGASCAEDGAEVRIDEVVPMQATPGAWVEVFGAGFCGDFTDCRPPGFISWGDRLSVVRDDAALWLDDELRLKIPVTTPPGAGFLVVTVAGRATNPVPFEVVDRAAADARR